MAENVPRNERRPIARALWAYQNATRRKLDPESPDVPCVDTPGGNLDRVVLALASYSPAQCMRALDIFAVEAECRRKTGDDPLEYLNGDTNWNPKVLARALATTPGAVRKRFKAKARIDSKPAAESSASIKKIG